MNRFILHIFQKLEMWKDKKKTLTEPVKERLYYKSDVSTKTVHYFASSFHTWKAKFDCLVYVNI